MGGAVGSFLTCQRDEELEREFSKFLGKSSSEIPIIFRLNDEGKEVKGEKVTFHGIPPYGPDVIIAVSGSGSVFLIYGTNNHQEEFKKLVRHYGVNLKGVDDAKKLVLFYLKIVNPHNIFPEILKSFEDVYDQAEVEFRIESDGKEWESLFEKWKLLHSDDINKLNFDILTTETKRDQFSVSFYVLSDIDPDDLEYGPVILRCTLELSSKGIFSDDIKTSPLWRK